MSTATMDATGLKLTCNAKAMLDAIALAGSVVKANTPHAILQNVKLTVDAEGRATVAATDSEVQIRVGVEGVEASGVGAMLLPPEKVAKILKTAESDSVSFEVAGAEILIVDGKSKFRLPWADPDKFPEVESVTLDDYHEVMPADIATAIKRTVYAVDTTGKNVALAGLALEVGDVTLSLIGFDGNRLSRMTVPAAAVGTGTRPDNLPVVPVKAIKTIERLADGNLPVGLAITPRSLLARSGSVEVTCRLLEGKFPAYKRIVDEPLAAIVPFDAGTLLRAVERAAITASDESRGVVFTFSAGQLSLSSRVSDRGASSVVIDADYLESPVEVILDNKYVIDVLKAIDAEAPVEMGLLSSGRRVQFRGADGYIGIVATQEKGGQS